MKEKNILVKAVRLQKYFDSYLESSDKKEQLVFEKFKNVWGENMASHFLSKYIDAESLIWAFDSRNLELFIEKF